MHPSTFLVTVNSELIAIMQVLIMRQLMMQWPAKQRLP